MSMTIRQLASIERVLTKHAAARKPMARWINLVRTADWKSIADARESSPTADAVKGTNLTCFNIGGNSFRLLVIVRYVLKEVEIHELLTHAEYNRKYVR